MIEMPAASAPDTIREALRAVGLTNTFHLLLPGHKDIPEKARAKHPEKHFYRFNEPIADSAVRNKLQQKLGSMVVCADGILVAIANGTSEVKPEPLPVAETVTVELPPNGNLEIPKLSHTAAVKDAEPLRPQLKARIERNVSNELYTTLKNNPRVTIELLWGNGDALNIAYVEAVS